MNHPELNARRERQEEILEMVGTHLEKGPTSVSDLLEHNISRAQIQRLVESNHLVIDEGNFVLFRPKGKREFLNLIRGHRLAERLLHDILDISDADSAEAFVCKMEHILTADVTDSICTLLGHPKTCPHGRPIPPGRCCELKSDRVAPLISTLTQLKPGEEGVIAFISTTDHEKMDRLAGMGLIPGVKLRLHQIRPAVVILFDETTLSMDAEYADIIYVRRR
jgi:DtxR family Mn-dependent transcriptional regulator